MNSIQSSLASAADFFKGITVPPVTAQQKRIAVVVAFALGCLAACYVLTSYLLNKLQNYKVSKRNPHQNWGDVHVKRYAQLDQNLIRELAQYNQQSRETGLTALLRKYKQGDTIQDLNRFLKVLVDEAVIHQNKQARLALTRPGFDQQTPFALLLKMDDNVGARLILSAYEAKDLLATTQRGNSLLHLAILMTAQGGVITIEIMKRARELGILDRLLSIENNNRKTADNLLAYLLSDQDNNLSLSRMTRDNWDLEELQGSWSLEFYQDVAKNRLSHWFLVQIQNNFSLRPEDLNQKNLRALLELAHPLHQ